MRDVWHLSELDWFDELTAEERLKLESASLASRFETGDTVFTPSDHPDSVFLLQEGAVRIYRLSEDGSETTFGYVTPGEVFGELPAFGQQERESFAQATERSVVWRVPLPVFKELLGGHPGLVFEVTKQIGERLRRVENRVENLVFRDVRTRVAHTLLELADAFGARDDGSVRIEAGITQGELATLVGSTRQTVNVSLRELEGEGLVRREGRKLVLPNPAALRAALPGREPRL